MSLIRRVTTNAGIILIGTLCQRAITFFLVLYVAHHVSVPEFGQYNIALSIFFIITFFIDMGIGPVTVREIARDKSRAEHLFSHILALRIVMSTLLYGVLVGYVALAHYDHATAMMTLVIGLSLFSNAVEGACETLNIAFENMRLAVGFRFVGMFFGAIACIAVMRSGHGLIGFLVTNFCFEVLTAIFWASFVYKRYFPYTLKFNLGEWRNIITHATPFALMLFLGQLNRNLNVQLLGKLAGPISSPLAVGYYGCASQVARVAVPLLVSMRQAIIPSLAAGSYDAKTQADLLKWTTKGVFVVVCLPLALAGFFFSEDIVVLLFTDKYRPAAPAFNILCLAFAFQAGMIGINGFLSASRDISKFVKYGAVSVVINVMIAVALIPKYGVNGAALGALISKAFEFGCAVMLCRKVFGREMFRFTDYFDLLLMSGVLAAGFWTTRHFLPAALPSSVVCLALYGIAAGLLIQWIRNRVRKMKGDLDQAAAAAVPKV